MNECILSRSRSYHCTFFDMSAEKMEQMFAFVLNLKAVIPPTEAEMAGGAEGAPGPKGGPASEGTSGGPLVVSPLRSRNPLEDVPRTPGADLVIDSDPEDFEEE
ncbi:hypothetical protein AXF42_Ash006518 [Apostasia shenzhenica]|uniref:Uncharacterized protein n=1 Tax=Apostasia shenzhenica TaxID=1088818 RepID=A0A2I0AZA8_9ASPA|nr:hypothetical protein AXF42_Ash006516 [Apostasia shenzhenica]PKA60883.1 hypothetical protein AXF42_Ash006518 [Apostasia shenzhenica]